MNLTLKISKLRSVGLSIFSAAPTYFPSVDGSLMDGGLIANNPAMDLLVDVQTYNAAAMLRNEPVTEVACLVSVGTGRKPSAKLTDIDLAIPGFNLQSITKSITALQNLKTILVEQVEKLFTKNRTIL